MDLAPWLKNLFLGQLRERLPIGMGALCCRGHVLAASQLTKTDGVPSFATSSDSGTNKTLLVGGAGAVGWPSSDKTKNSGPGGCGVLNRMDHTFFFLAWMDEGGQ